MMMDDVNLSKAHEIWKRASTFDPKVYDIMMTIVENEDVRILINRNPTLIKIWCRKTSLIAGNS